MKPVLLALVSFALFAGCANSPTIASLAGYYVSGPVALPPPPTGSPPSDWAEGDSAVYHLFVNPDGRFAASGQRFRHGQLLPQTGRGDRPIREKSTGTWALDGSQISLRPLSAASTIATVSFRNARWVLTWDGVEYAQQPPDDPEGWARGMPGAGAPSGPSREPTSSASRR